MNAKISFTLIGRLTLFIVQGIVVVCNVLESVGIDSAPLTLIGTNLLHSLATPGCLKVEIEKSTTTG